MTKPGTSRRRRQATKYYAIQKEEFIGWGGGARREGGRVKVAICRISNYQRNRCSTMPKITQLYVRWWRPNPKQKNSYIPSQKPHPTNPSNIPLLPSSTPLFYNVYFPMLICSSMINSFRFMLGNWSGPKKEIGNPPRKGRGEAWKIKWRRQGTVGRGVSRMGGGACWVRRGRVKVINTEYIILT